MNSKKRFRGFEVSSESPLLKGRKHMKHTLILKSNLFSGQV